MPGKINPVMPELAAMVSFQVIGNDTAVALAVQAGQLELNVMMPTMAYNVLQSITILANMLRQFTDYCIAGITANEQALQALRASTVSLATALNPVHRLCQSRGNRQGIRRHRASPSSKSPAKRNC